MRIILTPEEIVQVTNQLNAKAEEIDSATQAADQAVGGIRDMESPRLQRDIETWDNLKASIKEAVQALLDASQELKNLAEQNTEVNR